MYSNPFTPVFGSEPPFLGGREKLIGDVLKGLEHGPGDPNRVTIFTGPRGSGKTVLLQRITAEAQSRGWIGVHASAMSGMLEQLIDQVGRQARDFLSVKPTSKLTEISIAGIGVAREILPQAQKGWRIRMEEHLDELAEQNVGLLFSIDEVKATVKELEEFVSVFQFFIMQKRNVALVMAGLPGNVLQTFSLDSISFLRRAFLRKLDPISLPEVQAVLRDTIEMTGRSIERPALKSAAEQTGGLPFMIQLIGYHSFNQSNKETITTSDVKNGILDAKRDMESMILEATLAELSEVEQRFLIAMAQDEKVSKVADLKTRLNASDQYVGNYRRRLITLGIIAPAGRGKLTFAMPLLRDLLLERLEE